MDKIAKKGVPSAVGFPHCAGSREGYGQDSTLNKFSYAAFHSSHHLNGLSTCKGTECYRILQTKRIKICTFDCTNTNLSCVMEEKYPESLKNWYTAIRRTQEPGTLLVVHEHNCQQVTDSNSPPKIRSAWNGKEKLLKHYNFFWIYNSYSKYTCLKELRGRFSNTLVDSQLL